MTQEEYEQKKRERWEDFKRNNLDGEVQWQPVSRYDVFCAAFDHAFALGQQDAQLLNNPKQLDADTVIQGWVARDSHGGFLFVFNQKPSRHYNPKEYDGSIWVAPNKNMLELDEKLFPYLKSTDDPIEVEITIKRKKK